MLKRSSAPPENMLKMPRIVPAWSSKKRASAVGSIPGTGMNVPMRNTIRLPSRNSRRRRISPRRVASPKAAAGLVFTGFAIESLVFDLAAGGFDGRTCALGGRHALEAHRLGDLAREDHLGALGLRGHHARFDQRLQVDHLGEQRLQLAQADLGARGLDGGTEAGLRQTALQRHLAAFETHLVVTALARALALHAAAAGLALAGGSAATDAQPRALGAARGFDGVESHLESHLTFSTFNMCAAVAIMPRFCGVSCTSALWCMRRSPSPRTEAAMCLSCPWTLRVSVTLIWPAALMHWSPGFPRPSCRASPRCPRASGYAPGLSSWRAPR